MNMTQAEIDVIVGSMTGNTGETHKEISYHALVCRFCKQVILPEDLNMHGLLTRRGYRVNDMGGHAFISEGRLR